MPCKGCRGKARHGACHSCSERWCSACVARRRSVAPYLHGSVMCDECGRGFFGSSKDMDALLAQDCGRGQDKAGRVECLLRARASANAPAPRRCDGSSVLHAAAAASNASAVCLLLRYQADPRTLDRAGNTALHVACMCGDNNLTAVLSLIKVHPASLALANQDSFKPIDIASRNQFKRLESQMQREMARRERERGAEEGVLQGGWAVEVVSPCSDRARRDVLQDMSGEDEQARPGRHPESSPRGVRVGQGKRREP